MAIDEWTKEDWEKLNNMAFEKTDSILDSTEHSYFAAKTLVFALLLNFGILFGRLLLPKFFSFLIGGSPGFESTELFIYNAVFMIALFLCGFMITYSAFKWFKSKRAKNIEPKIASGFMSGFSKADERSKNYKIWFISSMGGFVNIFLIIGLVEIIEAFVKRF